LKYRKIKILCGGKTSMCRVEGIAPWNNHYRPLLAYQVVCVSWGKGGENVEVGSPSCVIVAEGVTVSEVTAFAPI